MDPRTLCKLSNPSVIRNDLRRIQFSCAIAQDDRYLETLDEDASFTCAPVEFIVRMTGIGAELPPHLLAKRKRQQEEKSPDARPVGPSLMGPLPPPKEEDEVQEKRRRVAGPAPPPAPLEQMPARPAESGPEQTETDESDSDDDFGPAAPNTSVCAPNFTAWDI